MVTFRSPSTSQYSQALTSYLWKEIGSFLGPGRGSIKSFKTRQFVV